jgi:S1-C subfamily serine protease
MARHIRRLAARFFSLTLLAGLITLGVAPAVGLVSTAGAAPAADASNKHGVDLASPAVVRIISNVSGQVICKGCANNGDDIAFPLAGGTYNLQFGGSGAFIAPDGYILTADHVVDYENNSGIIVDFLDAAIKEAAQVFDTTQDQMLTIFEQLIHQDKIRVPTRVGSQRAFLSTAYTGQLQNTAQVQGFDIARIVAHSPVDKRDLAIVKVEAHDMPFLKLASANEIKVHDTVTPVAYPGDADTGDFAALFNPAGSDVNTINSLLGASVNTGRVTAQKTLSDGTPVYETAGISFHGSSGGPVINGKGEIVGFVDAGLANARVVDLVASDVVKSYAQQAGIANPTGPFMTQWTKAINEYDATGPCHFTNAAADFKKIQTSYPNFGGVRPFLQDAQTKATPSECPAPSPLGGALPLLGLGLGVLALIAVVVIAVVARGRRNRHDRQPRLAPAGVPTASYGYGAAPATPNMHGQPTPQMPQTPMPAATPAAQQPYGMSASTGPVSSTRHSAPLAPTPYPATPAPAQPVAMPATRTCANGHRVTDPMAASCPQCGAPVNLAPQV